MSEKYSPLADDLYLAQKDQFDKILESKSYYLIRDLPAGVASRMLVPEVPSILARQRKNGLWSNSTKVTYDILSAFEHIGILGELITNNKIKDVKGSVADKYDYDSLLIKLNVYGSANEKDMDEIGRLIRDIRCLQSEDGSWDDSIVATVYRCEKLMSLGMSLDDPSVRKGIDFIIKRFRSEGNVSKAEGKTGGRKSPKGNLREDGGREFAATKSYYKEMDPRLSCYIRFGTIQKSLGLKLLIRAGLEHEKQVEAALDRAYSVYDKYDSFCYFMIQKKILAEKKPCQYR